MNAHLPANYTEEITVAPTVYLVTEFREKTFQFRGNGHLDHRPGQTLIFLDESLQELGRGYLYKLEDEVGFGSSFQLLNGELVRFCRVLPAWSAQIDLIALIVSDFFVPAQTSASLRAVCQVPQSYRPGQIRWSLYHRVGPVSWTEVIQGSDRNSGAVCAYTQLEAAWPVGEYKLVAQRYSTSGNLIAQAAQSWLLASASANLSCGGYADPQGKLYL